MVLALRLFAGMAFLAAATAFSDDINITAKEKAALARGELPPRLVEEFRWATAESPAGKQFQARMDGLAKKLFPPADYGEHSVRYVVVVDPRPNAYLIQGAKPPIIAFTTSLLKLTSSVDELAYVLGHEWIHKILGDKYGKGRNSKGEEFLADLWPLEALHRAGLDPRVGKLVLEKIEKASGGSYEPMNVLDVHGLMGNRIDGVEKGLAALEHQVGKLGKPPTATTEWTEIAEGSYVDSPFDNRLREALDIRRPTGERLKILKELASQIEPSYRTRAVKLTEALTHGTWDVNGDEMRRALAQVLDVALATSPRFEGFDQRVYAHNDLYEPLYAAVARLLAPDQFKRERDESLPPSHDGGDLKRTNQTPLPLIGAAAEVDRALRAFIEAQDAPTIVRRAKELVELLDRLKLPPELLQTLPLARFPFPAFTTSRAYTSFKEGAIVSWQPHYLASKADKSGIVRHALLRIGVEDRRLYAQMDVKELAKALHSSVGPITTTMADPHRPLVLFTVDADGRYRPSEEAMKGAQKASTPADKEIALALYRQREAFDEEVEDLVRKALRGDKSAEKIVIDLNDALVVSTPLRSRFYGDTDFHRNPGLFLRLNAWAKLANTAVGLDGPIQNFVGVMDSYARKGRRQQEVVRKLVTELIQPLDDKYLNDPLIHFVVTEELGVFTLAEKLKILRGVHPSNRVQGTDSVDTSYLHGDYSALQRILGIEAKPSTKAELLRAFQILQKSKLEYGKEFASILLLQYEPSAPSETLSLADFASWERYFSPRTFLASNAGRNWLAKQVQKQERWPTDPLSVATVWQFAHEHGLFPRSDDFEERLLGDLVDRIEAMPEVRRRLEVAERLLRGSRIENPKVRTRLHRRWASDAASAHGTDDGTDAFRERVRKLQLRLDQVNIQSRSELLDLFATEIQAQQPLAKQIRDGLGIRSRAELEQSHLAGVGLEAIAQVVRTDDDLRAKFQDFLTSAWNEAQGREILRLVDRAYTSDFDRFRSSKGNENPIIDHRVPTDRRLVALRRFYENFWSMPFEQRIVAMDAILLPIREGRTAKDYERAVHFGLNKLFPADMAYAVQARKLLEKYLDGLPDFSKTPFLAAVLVANEKTHGMDREVTVGERLALLLEQMGPAEMKLGQALHSYPGTPSDLRVGARRLKSAAAVPSRWELMDMYHRLPAELRGKIKHVGRVLGAASYYVNVEVTMQDGSVEVLGILRSNAKARAEYGFEKLHALVASLGTGDPMYSHFLELIDQARRSADIETDHERYRMQAELAEKLYEGYHVTVGEKRFTFDVAKLHETGPGYRLMRKAEGVHFSDLPTKTDADRALKKEIAEAYLALELTALFKGGQFDNDRHGAQSRLRFAADGTHIRLFDFGGMSLEPPSSTQRALLAEVIFDAVVAGSNWRQIGEAFVNRARSLPPDQQLDADYLIRLQRGLLALGEFFELVSANELKTIISAVAQNGEVHPDIQSAFLSRAMTRGKIPELMEAFSCAGDMIRIGRGLTGPT